MATYEDVHAGAIVLGHDGQDWEVETISHSPVLAVTLVRYGHRVTGYPPAGTEVTVIAPADVTAEWQAAGVLAAGLGPLELIAEHWES